MKFKIGKLYRVVKGFIPSCVGCVLRYKGITSTAELHGAVIRPGGWCQPERKFDCIVFNYVLDDPNNYKLVEHTDMVKFCKKLRKELKNDKKD